MKKLLIFCLEGNFGCFKYPFTSPNSLKKSYSIIPKTSLLGLLGAILGLNGFQDFGVEKTPEFYRKLKHIGVFVSIKKLPQKILLKYNSLNSFANNASLDSMKGNINIMIKEEILLNPKYEIGLLLDDTIEEDKMILENIRREGVFSKYHLYLGKNEFFANIKNVRVYTEGEFETEEVSEIENIDSIIPSELLKNKEQYNNIIYDTFSKDVDYLEGKLKTQNCEVGYFIEKEMKSNIEFENSIKICRIENNHYYIF